MVNINEKIDRHVRAERWQIIAVLVPSLLIFAVGFVYFAMPPLGPVTDLKGVAVELGGYPTEEGDKLYMLVRLDDGVTIRTSIPGSSYFKKGKRVKLHKREPLIFGRTVYRFVGYIADGA